MHETQSTLSSTDDSVLAIIDGQELTHCPEDLYIPPEALEVFLEAFEGPLDLLLYLIKKQNIDILNIPVMKISQQYIDYINLMQSMKFELAAEYLVMAATLAEIKSRLLLPRPPSEEEDDSIDPRAELIRRLQEYERFKLAAQELDTLPRQERDLHQTEVNLPDWQLERALPEVSMTDLLSALKAVYTQAQVSESHQVEREALSVRERMTTILAILQQRGFVPFNELFLFQEGRSGVVVTFLAILELAKELVIELVQNELFAPIHVRAV